ncbi:hypothetical protein D3C84_862940 [compost metagenome]
MGLDNHIQFEVFHRLTQYRAGFQQFDFGDGRRSATEHLGHFRHAGHGRQAAFLLLYLHQGSGLVHGRGQYGVGHTQHGKE